MCGHTNTINVCHTCPAAAVPYMASNNVFVIPALHPCAGAGGLGNLGNLNLGPNNLNTFLSGLGNGMSGFGGEMAGTFVNNGPAFSCRGCGLQMR